MTQPTATEMATERRSRPSLLVVVGPGAADVEVRRAADDGRRVHDARSEQPMASVEQLVADHALAAPALIVCLGSRTATAEALALVHDVPLATTSTLAPKRVEAIAGATRTGSELRCAVLDMRVDGSRRFAIQHIAIGGEDLAIRGLHDRAGTWSPQRAAVRISPAGVDSTDVIVHDGAGGHSHGHRVTITANMGWIAVRGPHQRFDRFDVEVHRSPLRQVVVGAPSRRRPMVDTVPL